VTSEAGDPGPSAPDGATEPEAEANGSAPYADDGAPASPGYELAEELDIPLDALLNWGTDPRDVDKALQAQAEEAIVAAERDEYLDALRRLQADFDNFRKRSMRQQTELLERATEGLCVRLLPVLDALELATSHVRAQGETNDAAKALAQIDSLLRDILAREGIERIDAVGVEFDPTIHDAVGRQPAAPEQPSTTAARPGDEAGDPSNAGTADATRAAGKVSASKASAGKASAGKASASKASVGKASAASEAGGVGKAQPSEEEARTAGETAEPDEAPASTGPVVAEVMRAGYRLKSKVLRPAMVLVGG